MADQASIDRVKSELPTWIADQTDWDDTKIGSLLDLNNGNELAICRLFWLQRVSDLSAITDISDAGSTRPLSQTYQHAQDMFKYWDAIAGQQATSVSKIRRRYRKRGRGAYGIAESGGVYARTD